jgi:hypothetical protein
MMAGEDFDPPPVQQAPSGDASLPAGPGGQSDDVSQPSGLRRAWDAWTSRPENNAALLQFGLNMMSPYPGNFAGHLAESIGSGAEAMSRSTETQRKEETEDEASALKQQEEARKERETDYYGQSVRTQAANSARAAGQGGITPLKMWQAQLRAGSDFDKQLDKAPVGMGDTMWEELQQKYPGKYKTKLDYKNSPQFQQDRQAYIRAHSSEQLAGMDLGSGGNQAAPPGGGIPDGTIIKRGDKKRIMQNGQWVDMGE